MKHSILFIAMLLFSCFVHGQSPAKKELTPETKQFVQYWKQIANLSGDLVEFKKETGVSLQPKLDEESKKSLPKLYQAFDELLMMAMGDDNNKSAITENFSLKGIQDISKSGLNNSSYAPIEDETKPIPFLPDAELAVKSSVTYDLKKTLPENRLKLVDYNINLGLAKVNANDNNKAFYDELTKQLMFSMIIYKKWINSYNQNNRNLLLFVNGYRFKADVTLDEFPNSNNKVYQKDLDNYWEGIDSKFIGQIKTSNTIYADGHHSISTSNHMNMDKFASSMTSSGTACAPVSNCYHSEVCVHLNKTPNVTGFDQRRLYGKLAAQDMYQKLINGTIHCRKALVNGELKILDTIDVVCHSMGFAYTLGMIDELKSKIDHFGWLYCVAPENGCTGEVPLNNNGLPLFEEMWQYGSNELPSSQGGDVMWEQDGIAPQCAIKGLEDLSDKQKFGRVYIPKAEPKGFIASHSIKSYEWIFKREKNDKGYVKARK